MPAIKNLLPGEPSPLGATVKPEGINFAVFSSGATRIELLLFDNVTDRQPSQVIPLDQEKNRTVVDGFGPVWHIFVEGLPSGTLYNYRADGPYNPAADGTRYNVAKTLLDPYSVAVTGDFDWLGGDALGYDNTDPSDKDRHLRPSSVQNTGGAARCVALKSTFDWEGDRHPDVPIEESIIYEVNVRGFTRHHSAESDFGGTYRGFIEKIAYLKELGVTAVELLPVFEFDRFDGPFRDPLTKERLANAWGYNTVAFFAPESHYSYYGKVGAQVDEFKMLVRELHKHNIEVILDVVFNHTREGNHMGPTISFRGLDNQVYYMLMPDPQFYNDFTGCGNTLNCNHPVVRRFILDCLRYWVTEMHVDGFRFDLAAVFAIDVDQQEKGKTPIIHEIETDPVLSRIKLIAEPWSIRQYRLGSFSDRRWAEWNGKFRDTVRKWVKGEPVAGEVASRLAGSYDLFAPHPESERSPFHSINFVTCHDGFTLNDLVSFNDKHNERNGEGNRDGANDNNSWNCGFEGLTDLVPLPPAHRRAAGRDRGPAEPPDQELPDDPLPLAGDADAPLRRRDAPDGRGGQQHRLPGQQPQLDQLGADQEARRRAPVHTVDRRLPQAAPDRPPLALPDGRRRRDADPPQHHLARRQARRGGLRRPLPRLDSGGLPDRPAFRPADLRRHERLLGADHGRASRDRREALVSGRRYLHASGRGDRLRRGGPVHARGDV